MSSLLVPLSSIDKLHVSKNHFVNGAPDPTPSENCHDPNLYCKHNIRIICKDGSTHARCNFTRWEVALLVNAVAPERIFFNFLNEEKNDAGIRAHFGEVKPQQGNDQNVRSPEDVLKAFGIILDPNEFASVGFRSDFVRKGSAAPSSQLPKESPIDITCESACLESYPCQHRAEITLPNGTKKSVGFMGTDGYLLFAAFGERVFKQPWIKEHFSGYAKDFVGFKKLLNPDERLATPEEYAQEWLNRLSTPDSPLAEQKS